MPRTGPRASPQLSIELDDAEPTYFPGETLQGRVVCKTLASKSLQAQSSDVVRLKLFGRAKTKYTVKTTNGTSIERGRAIFFEECQVLRRRNDGDVAGTCGDGAHAVWPFSITIPETSQPGFKSRKDGDEFRADHPFLHSRDDNRNEIDVTLHPLPSVMYYKSESSMSGKTVEAYIEYVLVAEGQGTTATYPLYVRQKAVPSPIQNYRMQTRTFQEVIKTPRLLPELVGADLTFRQKLRMFFGSSKTPRYSYAIKVEYPTVIQLEHPEPVPLKIYLVPDLDAKKTTIYEGGSLASLPPVTVVKMEFTLKGDVNIRCPGMMWDTSTEKNHTFDFQFWGTPVPVDIPVLPPPPSTDLHPIKSTPEYSLSATQDPTLPLATTQSSPSQPAISQNTQGTQVIQTPTGWRAMHATTPAGTPSALNLGAHASLLLGTSASSTLNNRPVSFKRQVYPTFATYNIHIKYRLRWRIWLSCAGEEHDVSGETPVVVLPPSEQQEELKKRELGMQGVKKNYDDLEAGVGSAVQFVGLVLQALGA